ncbi:MAG: DEAD/DEAH box helicase family protein [Erysipelotrichaceae bacterium]|nr:DEAD/DEAH box helicase family protein [Erysipelotrichaceae bacterium]
MHAKLNYSLTIQQQKASDEILYYLKQNQDVIVNAVCGAGKTELCYQAIEYYINQGKRVAFAIPRKDICIEIYARLKKDYPSLSMCLVYGNHHDKLNGQLVVLTTHQLFRYKEYFDMLILDEADAFPYYKNDLLASFLHISCKGPIIYMSATIMDIYKRQCNNIVYINRRFHQIDLPVPIFIRYTFFNKYEVLKQTLNKLKNKLVLIFVPTIDIGKKLSSKTHIDFIYAALANKDVYLNKFKNKEIKILITTSILERGITIKDVQVIVFEANHRLFDEASLIQISGRVGRKITSPTGKVFFLATNMSEEMNKCIKEIKRKNNSE